MHSIEDLAASLQLEPVGDNRYRAGNLPVAHGVVFGGQLMGQSIVAALAGQEGKTVKTLHTVFARAGSTESPVEIVVEPIHSGRTLSSTTVTIRQGDRICTKSSVLLSADDDDLIRHAEVAPAVAGPDESVAAPDVHGDWEIRVVDGVDISDPDAVGPPVLDVWTRFVGAPDDAAMDQALVAFATDGFLIGTAMRPHPGVGQALAHRTLSTAVLSHTITFHEPCRASEWLLLSNRSSYAGRSRAYGRADLFTQDGRLVASYVQDSMIRAMPEGVHL